MPSLLALAGSDRHQLVGVATQPDRPSGRNRQVRPGLVHEAARQRGIPVMQPEKIGSPEALEILRTWSPDVIAVASYGQYIPGVVLKMPPQGVLNVHPSLLPAYRGAAPLQWSIARGETVSGVTLFFVEKEMDAGPILLQARHAIEPGESAADLSERFSRIGAGLLLESLDLIATGHAQPVPQQHAHATYAPKIEKGDGLIDWTKPASEIHNMIRGFQPWPGGHFVSHGKIIKVWKSALVEGVRGVPGTVASVPGDGPVIITGAGGLQLIELQPEGGKRMNGKAFLCGHAWKPGTLL